MSEGKRVCVTGASGFIASHLIELLIKAGYSVNGTVRSLSNTERVDHLRSQFSGSLDLFEADLLVPGSFDKAVEGCAVVFHTASPFQLQVKDPVKDLVEPALQGTLNVLESVKKAGISRVIVTSSVAAIVPNTQPEDPNKLFSEEDWNLESTPEDSVGGYRYSKRVAEEAAWKFAKENNIKLSTINPCFVVGPALSKRTDSTSIKTFIGFLLGAFKSGAGSSCYGCVDVREVALAHIRAYEREEAVGSRFLISSSHCYTHMDLVEVMKQVLTEDIPAAAALIENLPTGFASPPKWKANFDISRAKTVLGIEPRCLRESIRDLIQFLLDTGLVTIPSA